jgi:hypothetical protein
MRQPKKLPSQKYLNDTFNYIDGHLYYKANNKKAGCDTSSYSVITIDKTQYYLHRIIFKMIHGIEPQFIDHKNLNPSDNRIENLRNATPEQNRSNVKKFTNNKSGFKGVSWCNSHKKWVAVISSNRKRHFLGFFDDLLVAAQAYQNAAKLLHKEFALW